MKNREKLTGKKHRNKKKIIVTIIILAAAAAAGTGIWYVKVKKPAMEAAQEAAAYVPATQTAAKQDIESTYQASGKFYSMQESIANAQQTASGDSTSGYPVKKIYVKVGDQVKKGDPLYSLDMSSVQSDLSANEKKLSLQEQANAIAQGTANRAVTEAQQAQTQQEQDAARKQNNAAEDTNLAIVDQLGTQVDEAKAKQDYDAAKAEFDAIDAEYQKKKKAVDDAKAAADLATANETKVEAYTDTSANTDGDPNTYADTSQLTAAKEASADAAYAYQQAVAAMGDIETKRTDAQTKMNDAKAVLDSAQSARKAADGAEDYSVGKDVITANRTQADVASQNETDNRTAAETTAKAKDDAATAAVSGQQALVDTQTAIEKAKETLENGTVYAGMDGTVTAINVTAGQTYSGTSAVVLNNLDSLKIVAEIDEGHIADISVGSKVYITTASTGDTPLLGTVIYTAATPTTDDTSTTSQTSTSGTTASATSAASSSSSSTSSTSSKNKVTYRVEVTPDEPSDRLRIGMNATLQFILGTSKDAIVVPTTCIQDDGNGGKYVTVVTFGDTTSDGAEEAATDMTGADAAVPDGSSSSYSEEMVPVTTGLSDDYYTEITSGNITEGMQIEDPTLSSGMDAGTTGGTDLLEGVYAD